MGPRQDIGAVGVPTFGGVNVSSRYRGSGDMSPLLPGYHNPDNCDSSDTGAVFDGGASAGNAGRAAVMGTGGD